MSELGPWGFLVSNGLILGLYLWVTHTRDVNALAWLFTGVILGHVWKALRRAWRADRASR